MCTAITYRGKNNYFGRNLDLEYRYNEKVTITPRRYDFMYRNGHKFSNHYAIIGMATISNDYPLYYDGTNEVGLSMAGLYFPDNAWYGQIKEEALNVASFEFIPWILGKCSCIREAIDEINDINISGEAFSEEYKVAPLHWIIADKEECITVESVKSGLNIYDNPVGVLTNNPPFKYHMINLANYMSTSSMQIQNKMMPDIRLEKYSNGMGAIGLPGDWSSMSRFVKAAFVKHNSVPMDEENEMVGQFFHMLGSVSQIKGCVITPDGLEKTVYTSCCNMDKGIYYYKTYGNSQINGVNMWNCDLDGEKLVSFQLEDEEKILYRN